MRDTSLTTDSFEKTKQNNQLMSYFCKIFISVFFKAQPREFSMAEINLLFMQELQSFPDDCRHLMSQTDIILLGTDRTGQTKWLCYL